MNFYYPNSLEDLQQGIERTIDRGATAFKVSERMDKHGEELGPNIQVHIADFATYSKHTTTSIISEIHTPPYFPCIL